MSEFGFFLKKTIAYFVEPFGMFIALFMVGIYFLFRNRIGLAKLFLSFSFFVVLLFSYSPFSNYLVSSLENQYPKYDYTHQEIKYIHVLGNGHNTDPDQPLSSKISGAGMKRNIEGIIIHFNTEGSKLIFTGFKGNSSISTAKMNEKFALALGVKKEDMIISPLPRDTKEEALFTKTIVGSEPFILVTSATHMPRSMMLFRSLGLNPIPAPTSFYKNEFKGYFRLPDIGSFGKSQIAMHEYIGMLWSKLRA